MQYIKQIKSNIIFAILAIISLIYLSSLVLFGLIDKKSAKDICDLMMIDLRKQR